MSTIPSGDPQPEPQGDTDAQPLDVFISYSSTDVEHAEQLEETLASKGLRVWRDKQRLKAGEHIDFAIPAALRNARAVVVIWSNASVASDWVRH
jgi:hypothetical protein